MADGTFRPQLRRCPACDVYRDHKEFAGPNRSAMCLLCKVQRKEKRNAERCAALMAELPAERGQRKLVAVVFGQVHAGHGGYLAVVVCSCSRETSMPAYDWKRGHCGDACSSCAGRARSFRERVTEPPPGVAPRYMATLLGAWANLPPERDQHYQAFIAAFDSGATLDAIGEFYGITHERVRQIEAGALRKLRARDSSSRLRKLLEELDDAGQPTGRRQGQAWDEIPTFDHEPRRIR